MMDFPDYIDENGKVWTHYDIELQSHCSMTSDEYRQILLDERAERSGWSEYVQPDPYQERMENSICIDCIHNNNNSCELQIIDDISDKEVKFCISYESNKIKGESEK